MSPRQERAATCPLCEAMCGVLVEVDGQRIREIRGDRDDPFSRGYICPKAAALADLHDDPERIRKPLVRAGSNWREASWEEALDRAAGGLAAVRRRHGRDAVALYYGNPVAHNLGLLTHGLAFRQALGTRNVYSASSADQLPQMLAALRMFGHFALIPVPDLDRTDFFLVVGANPVVSNGSLMSAPDMRRRLAGIRTRPFGADSTGTTRHAHVVLPPAPPLARAHYDLALNAFAVRNVAKYVQPVVPRTAGQRHDWEILVELGGRTLAPRLLRPLVIRAARALHPDRLLDLLLRAGPHHLTLAKLRAAPHGIDLGPLQPGRVGGRVATSDGRVDIAPKEFVCEGRNRLVAEADSDTAGALVLIGRRHLRSNNSWMHNSPRLMKGPPRCTLLVHPDDAASRRLATGDLAELESEAGAVTVAVEVSDTMRRGVVSLPHGWGHHRAGARLSVAREHAGVSANDVTSDRFLDTLSGNAAFNGLPVTVRRSARSARTQAGR